MTMTKKFVLQVSLLTSLASMKKNSLETRRKQHESLLEEERRNRERKERKVLAREERQNQSTELGEVDMTKKEKFQRRVLPRREYKARRRQAKLAKYAPRLMSADHGDIDMADLSKPKRVIPVSKNLRLVKDKDSSISKH